MVALAGPRYRAVPGWKARIGERIDEASDQLAARFGLGLELTRLGPWSSSTANLDALLIEVGEARPAPRADLVFVFTAAAPPKRTRTRHLVQSRYANRYVVARSQAAMFPPEAGELIHAAEVRALLHGVGRIFGALEVCAPAIMAEQPGRRDRRAYRWDPVNLALVRAHATLDLRREGVPPDLAARAAAILATPSRGMQRCGGRGLEARRKVLAEVGVVAAQPKPAAPPPDEAAVALAAGLSALESGDAKAAYALCAPIAERRPALAARCAGLAAESLGLREQAILHLRAHLAARPDDEDAVLRLAMQVGKGGDDGAARALLARYVAANPNHVKARVNLGVAWARLGDYVAARRQWEAVLALDPQHADAKALLRQLPK